MSAEALTDDECDAAIHALRGESVPPGFRVDWCDRSIYRAAHAAGCKAGAEAMAETCAKACDKIKIGARDDRAYAEALACEECAQACRDAARGKP